MNGWVKLHIQIIDNPIWRKDQTAWHLFEYLLLSAYRGTPQGSVVTSRFHLADILGGNTNTIYKALKRLEKAEMITTSATNKYTTIRICNWNKYQTDSNKLSNTKVTTGQQQSNTLLKNKDIDNTITNVIEPPVEYGDPNINIIVKSFEDQVGKMARVKHQRIAGKTLISRYGVERVVKAIEFYAIHARGKPYSPNIANLEDLRDRWVNLETFAGKEYGNKQKGMVHKI